MDTILELTLLNIAMISLLCIKTCILASNLKFFQYYCMFERSYGMMFFAI